MNDQDAIDQVAVFKMIVKDAGSRIHAAWGYVANYDPATNQVQVTLPSYQQGWVPNNAAQNAPLVSPWMPLGTPYAGKSYGFECYPDLNVPCLELVIDEATGSSLSAVLFHNNTFPAIGGLQQGECQLVSKAGKSLKFTAGGQTVFNGGSTPVAVQGSTVTHAHGLYAYNTTVAAALTSLASSPPATIALLIPALAAIFTTLAGLTPPLTPTSVTDTAGAALTNATSAAVDSGQGAQDILMPSAGGS
jgi:hypothetical protein